MQTLREETVYKALKKNNMSLEDLAKAFKIQGLTKAELMSWMKCPQNSNIDVMMATEIGIALGRTDYGFYLDLLGSDFFKNISKSIPVNFSDN